MSEQKVVIQKKLLAPDRPVPEDVVAKVLDVFVSDDGTKIPIPYIKIAEQQNQLTGKFANRLTKLNIPLLAACLNELEYARILRRSETDYEIAHDTLAAIVDQQRSAEQRQLREIERRIELGYREHQESKQSQQLYYFNAGQLARMEPFLEKATLQEEWIQFLEDCQEELKRLERKEQAQQQAVLEQAQQQAEQERKLREAAEKARNEAEIQETAALKAKGESEKQRFIAQQKEKQARQRTRWAVFAFLIALVIAGYALWQFQRLKAANENSVELLLTEVDRNIRQLDYDAALEKTIAALNLDAKVSESKKRLQEIAFVYTESEQWKQAATCLQVVGIIVRDSNRIVYLEKIEAIHPTHFRFLQSRYYPEMVLVEGGEFEMGNIEGDEDERGVHQVQLDNFYLSKTETTNWQYYLFAKGKQREMRPPSWQIWGNNPVVYVDWYDAVEYMNWLSSKKGKTASYEINKMQKDTNSRFDDKQWLVTWDSTAIGYRLPTEAEWEYAAKGGKQKQSYKYAGSDTIEEVGWYDKSRTQAVAQLKANALGIYDMSGNVWEWCYDWYGNYPSSPQKNPQGPKNGLNRVLRGGGWINFAEYCRVSYRGHDNPDNRSLNNGFRLAHSQ